MTTIVYLTSGDRERDGPKTDGSVKEEGGQRSYHFGHSLMELGVGSNVSRVYNVNITILLIKYDTLLSCRHRERIYHLSQRYSVHSNLRFCMCLNVMY